MKSEIENLSNSQAVLSSKITSNAIEDIRKEKDKELSTLKSKISKLQKENSRINYLNVKNRILSIVCLILIAFTIGLVGMSYTNISINEVFEELKGFIP